MYFIEVLILRIVFSLYITMNIFWYDFTIAFMSRYTNRYIYGNHKYANINYMKYVQKKFII